MLAFSHSSSLPPLLSALWPWLWISPCILGTVTKTNRRISVTWPPNIQTSSSTCTPASPEDLCKYLRVYSVYVYSVSIPTEDKVVYSESYWLSLLDLLSLTIIVSYIFEVNVPTFLGLILIPLMGSKKIRFGISADINTYFAIISTCTGFTWTHHQPVCLVLHLSKWCTTLWSLYSSLHNILGGLSTVLQSFNSNGLSMGVFYNSEALAPSFYWLTVGSPAIGWSLHGETCVFSPFALICLLNPVFPGDVSSSWDHSSVICWL